MTTSLMPALPATGPAHRDTRSGRFWPAAIVGLLGLNATIVAITVYFAQSDRSVATEPDYYAQSLSYNDIIQQRATNARLGWCAEPVLEPAVDHRGVRLSVRLGNHAGQPVTGAVVNAVAFASVNSAKREPITLRPVADGVYAAPITISRPGLWYINTTATKDGDTFTSQSQIMIPRVAAARK